MCCRKHWSLRWMPIKPMFFPTRAGRAYKASQDEIGGT
jgi:hypothetical protein